MAHDQSREQVREALKEIARLATTIEAPELRYLANRRLRALQGEEEAGERESWTKFPPHPEAEPETRDEVASDALQAELQMEFASPFVVDVFHWFNTESRQIEWGARAYRGNQRTAKPAAWDRGGTAERACLGVKLVLRADDPDLGIIQWPGHPGRYDGATLEKVADAVAQHEDRETKVLVPGAVMALKALKPLRKALQRAQGYRGTGFSGDGLRILLPLLADAVDEEIDSTRRPIRYARVPGAERGRPKSQGQKTRELLTALHRSAGEAALAAGKDPNVRKRKREAIKRSRSRTRRSARARRRK